MIYSRSIQSNKKIMKNIKKTDRLKKEKKQNTFLEELETTTFKR